tara:strand:+ start:19 stop:1182 length:1164 start_codon:yes stop_codon:yes gene_type:complete
MAKNRVIYQSDALFVSQTVDSTGASQHAQLRRVQSANYSFNVARQDITQFGQLARLDAIILEAPTVSFDMSYYLADGFNEQALSFQNSTKFVSGFIKGQIDSTSGNNFYILTAPEGIDANFNTASSAYSTVGIGNAFLTDYSLEASVGSIPTISCSFEGTNMNATANVSGGANGYSGISGVGIDPELGTVLSVFRDNGVADQTNPTGVVFPAASTGDGPSALRPGDITLSFANADGDAIVDLDGDGSAHVQSVSMSIPLGRTPIDRLGTRFSFARVVDFPITPTLSVSAIVSETQTRALTEIVNVDDFISELQFTFSDTNSTPQASYVLKNLKLDSESFSSSIGPNKTVDLSFSLSIGGPDDTTNNVFFSGANNTTVLGNTRGPQIP